MSDMTQTSILRIVAMVFITFWAIVGVIFVDMLLDKLHRSISDDGFNNGMERIVFWAIVLRLTWDWVARRLWVGSRPEANHDV